MTDNSEIDLPIEDIVAGMVRLRAEQQAGLTQGTDQLVEQLPVSQ